jgi:hypothetical protein
LLLGRDPEVAQLAYGPFAVAEIGVVRGLAIALFMWVTEKRQDRSPIFTDKLNEAKSTTIISQ